MNHESIKAGDPHKTLAHWQGRSREISKLQQRFDDRCPLIAIEGIGGTGKSSLAAKMYEDASGLPMRFWADLTGGVLFTDVARRFLQACDRPVPEERVMVEVLVKCLQEGHSLLVLDNLESILEADRSWQGQFWGEFFDRWVECGNSSSVLVTTRERPQTRGFEWLTLEGLTPEEGAALLQESGIGGELREFAELVEGHPLLLRLVADLLKEEFPEDPSLERLSALGLGNLREMLSDLQVVGVHRRQTVGMELVLDASFNRLNDILPLSILEFIL